MEEITLKEIKDYCAEKGINIVAKNETPTVVANVQTFGDISAEAYFSYYVEHSAEIEQWRQSKNNEVINTTGISK